MSESIIRMDAGLGKSHLAMALASRLLEADEVDIIVICAEASKLVDSEWPTELRTYSTFDWKLYYGTPAKRAKIRKELPQLLLTSYDIIKRDAVVFEKKGKVNTNELGPLLEVLKGKRVLVVYDETSRISNRGSATHKAHKFFTDYLRAGGCTVVALTATPMERDPVSFYDLCRILKPELVGTVAEFERSYVAQYDIFRKPIRFRNLEQAGCDPRITPFCDRVGPILLSKNKTDPDVVDFFPEKREMPITLVELGPEHQKFYNMVQKIARDSPEHEQRKFTTVLRQIAGHPLALTVAEGNIARAIVDHVTPEGLAALGSAKTDRMVEWCNEVVKVQGEHALIFTFYAKTILPFLQEALTKAGYTVGINRGGDNQANAAAQAAFKAGDTQILLSSDAGAKGINLPNAGYLLHYERPPLHTLFIQRSDRIHRINSKKATSFIYSLIARNTIEEGLYNLSIRRNEWSDKTFNDTAITNDDFLTAADRKALFAESKRQSNR